MKEKQLFPRDTSHLARMILCEDDDGNKAYVVQSGYNKEIKTYESELTISVGSPTAELEAWNAYLGSLDTAVNKILRERPGLKAFFAGLAQSTADTQPPTRSRIKQVLDGLFCKITTLLR